MFVQNRMPAPFDYICNMRVIHIRQWRLVMILVFCRVKRGEEKV
jgi:hypothetical protein